MKKVFALQRMLSSVLLPPGVSAADIEIMFPEVVIAGPTEEGKKAEIGDYLALHRKGERFFLSKSTAHYEMIDKELGQISSNIADAIFYIRGGNIQPGEVATGSSKESQDPTGKAVAIRVTKDTVKIVMGDDTYYVAPFSKGVRLTHQPGNLASVYPSWGFYIIWAGDLDRDGKLDLITSSEDEAEKNTTDCLSLSSAAKPPELVKQVACVVFGG